MERDHKSGFVLTPFYWIIVASWCFGFGNAWNINLEPNQLVNADQYSSSFCGSSAVPQNFKLADIDGNSLLIGGRNVVYNLSIDVLGVQAALEWPPTSQDIETCRMKGKSKDDCQNYIRVLAKQRDGRMLVCGTHAFKPTCRQYVFVEEYGYQVQREFSGFAISPYDHRQNSSTLYLAESDEIYAGSVSDFTGSDPLIYRKPISGATGELRTQRNNMKCLNDPDFISVVDDDEAVYFFFRETALEYANCVGTNGGKVNYARVGRVCKNDQGGTRTYADTWTTFTKARLNCSLPGLASFYFDELQSTAIAVNGSHGARIVYGVFTTPYNGLQASAVCAYRLDDVKRILSQSPFKVQNGQNSYWAPIQSSDSSVHAPRTCSESSKNLPDDVLQFIQKNSLVDEAVPSLFNEALMVHSDQKSRFTRIAVHPNVAVVNGAKYDVLFVGDNNGHVSKLITLKSNGKSIRTIFVEKINVFPDGTPIDNLLVHSPMYSPDERKNGRLVIVSQEEVKSLPLYHCRTRITCGACVALQDPYCAWDVVKEQCIGRSNGDWSDGQYKQAIEDGKADGCYGEEEPEDKMFVLNDLNAQSVSSFTPSFYGSEIHMAVAIIVTLTVATAIGFLIGYKISQWKRETEYSSTMTSCQDEKRTIVMDGAPTTGASPTSRFVRDDDEAANLVSPYKANGDNIFHVGTAVANDEHERFLNPLDNAARSKEYKVRKLYM